MLLEDASAEPREEDLESDDQGGDSNQESNQDSDDHGETISHHFVVENECDGWRLDRFLQKKIKRLSRNRIQRIINGDCDVQGRAARPGMRVFSGQGVSFRRPAPPEPEVPRNISIAHTDPSFYVLEKPSGLPIHPTARYYHSTLTAVLKERFPDERLQVAHRLDRETSGLLLVGRHFAAASSLKQAFQKRLVHKRYLAIVHGCLDFAGPELIIDEPIGPAETVVRVRMAVRPVAEGGLPARTAVTVLSRGPEHTLVECRPHTGRQHQIRVHLHFIGHPIVGDKLYPDEDLFIRWAEGGDEAIAGELPLSRHALHAAGLRFPHPDSGEPVVVSSPLPSDLRAFLAAQNMQQIEETSVYSPDVASPSQA